MKADNNLVGVLMMIKNEESSIAVTINSVKNYIKHIIIFDTGSTDKTIQIVKHQPLIRKINYYYSKFAKKIIRGNI